MQEKEWAAQEAQQTIEELRRAHQSELQELKDSTMQKVDAMSHAKA